MVHLYSFRSDENVLLLGEGNFSFTISLLKYYREIEQNVNVISTCFQSYKSLSHEVRLRAREANMLGAEIWFGVDATLIHMHERFKDLVFEGVIFNFPHINGKMKIDRNRLLLKNFFASASQVLSLTGKILVTLCQGQSGTPFDVKQRRDDDSWKAVTMATCADLVLRDASPFSASDWEDYACSGYRGLEKRFHVENAYTFLFCKSPLSFEKCQLLCNELPGEPHCDYVKTRVIEALRNNVFPEAFSFKKYLEARTYPSEVKIVDSITSMCMCSQTTASWWDTENLFTVPDNCLKCLLVCNCCSKGNFQEQIQKLVVFSYHSMETISRDLFHWSGFYEDEPLNTSTKFKEIIKFRSLTDGVLCGVQLNDACGKQMLAINIKLYFRTKANFMSPKLSFPRELNVPILSLHPPIYSHDISMWTTPEFAEKKFSCYIRNIAGDLISDFKLVDSYVCPLTGRKSLCYRLTYQSFRDALSPTQCYFLHAKIVGPILERHLNVIVR